MIILTTSDLRLVLKTVFKLLKILYTLIVTNEHLQKMKSAGGLGFTVQQSEIMA